MAYYSYLTHVVVLTLSTKLTAVHLAKVEPFPNIAVLPTISDVTRFMGYNTSFIGYTATFIWPISLEPLLAETPNSVCCLVLRSSFALLFAIQFASLFFIFLFFFLSRFCPGHISGTVTRRDSKLSVLLGPAV